MQHPIESKQDLSEVTQKFISPSSLKRKVTEYKQSKWDEKKQKYTDIPSVSGLAHHLGVTTSTLLNYKDLKEFRDIIDEALQWMEMIILEKSMRGSIPATMAQFYLTHIQKMTELHDDDKDESEKSINITIVEPSPTDDRQKTGEV